MSVSTNPTLLCCSPIDPQHWVAYVKAPTLGHLGTNPNDGSSRCRPQQWAPRCRLQLWDYGSPRCRPQQWFNYMPDPNNGLTICPTPTMGRLYARYLHNYYYLYLCTPILVYMHSLTPIFILHTNLKAFAFVVPFNITSVSYARRTIVTIAIAMEDWNNAGFQPLYTTWRYDGVTHTTSVSSNVKASPNKRSACPKARMGHTEAANGRMA